jgi:hypothetical protein
MSSTDDALMIGAVGVTVSAPNGSSSASTTMPTNANGDYPKYVRVACTAGSFYFRWDWGKTGTCPAATTGDLLINVSDSQIVCVNYSTKFTVYGVGAITPVVVTPLENSR